MVARILGLDAVPKAADAADALALAICHAWRTGGVAARRCSTRPRRRAEGDAHAGPARMDRRGAFRGRVEGGVG